MLMLMLMWMSMLMLVLVLEGVRLHRLHPPLFSPSLPVLVSSYSVLLFFSNR